MTPYALLRRVFFGQVAPEVVLPPSSTSGFPTSSDRAWNCAQSGCIPDAEHCVYCQEEGA